MGESMNLVKLFEMQKVLRDKIIKRNNLEGQDLLPNLFLSLMTELGELANEERSWKHWSKDRKPRTKAVRVPTMMEEDKEYHNPLLEEFADCLSFALEIGLSLGFSDCEYWGMLGEKNITNQFIETHRSVSNLTFLYRVSQIDKDDYELMFNHLITLGKMLGFTWDQIEQAYFAKNAINHERQTNGY